SGGSGNAPRVRARDRGRPVRGRGAFGRDSGGRLQADRQTRVPDGADPPPFRTSRLVRADGRDPLLDHQLCARASGPSNSQAQVITARAFAGKRYAVYGLARSGLATAAALVASGADVTTWDAKEEARGKAPAGTQID